ncbi:hypothetical protein [Marispirochaeta aestuarii]|uniref:hypothetical protein n=1 Tax=Marispirochaeta aestuarii TaxID=1963862 RepID=UPI002ABDD878|nr:hypothetical protein [Marispirochaeta aestuarii]
MIRIAHLADLHFRKEKITDITTALDAFEYQAIDRQVDLIAIAGDTWDGVIQNTEGSEFKYFIERIRRLADIAPVVLIYGTPTHDAAGSLEVFESLIANHSITILRPGISYYLSGVDGDVCEENGVIAGIQPRLLIFGIPEPSKKWLLANNEAIGKETAADAAAQALQNLFLGLAALREQSSDLPCLVLYHGRVRGATFSNGQLSDDGVARDVLTSIGANYYALGDIHEPQEVAQSAWYPGSLYSTNWGETHKPGWNLVEIYPGVMNEISDQLLFEEHESEWKTDITRVELPLPKQVKYTVSLEEFDNTNWPPRVSDRKVWVEITGRKEDLSGLDPEYMAIEVLQKDYGALPGSRVTLLQDITETVRAAEITEKKKLRDKVQLWAEASDSTVDERVLEKADEIEEEAKRSGVISSSAHIRLKKLILRGAVGVWKGQRKEEVVLDLENYDAGLIALIGVNGAGKTTLIENLHPWPQMLTRTGKIQDHFFLRDSFRDLYFSDERTGMEYRAFLQIDGKNKSGSVEYHLYRNTGAGFEPVPDINGRREVYIQKIEDLFGSLPLYLKSAFISQRPAKGNPDLLDATKGEKKALFAELAGIDYLSGYAEIAKNKAKVSEDNLLREEARREAITDMLSGLPELEEKLTTGRQSLNTLERDLSKEEQELSKAENTLHEAERAYRRNNEIKRQIEETGRKIAEINTSVSGYESRLEEYRIAARHKEQAAKAIERYEELTHEKDRLTTERTVVYEMHQQAVTKYNNETKALRDYDQTLHTQEINLEREIHDRNSKSTQIDVLRKSLDQQIAKLEGGDKICPTCGQSLPPDALEKIEVEIRELREEIAGHIRRQKEIEEEIGVHQKSLEEIQKQIAEIDWPEEPGEADVSKINAAINSIDEELDFIDITNERRLLQKAQEAETMISELEEQLTEKKSLLSTLRGQETTLQESFDPDYLEALEEATAARDGRLVRVQNLKERRAAYIARIEELQGQIEQLGNRKAELEEITESIEKLKLEAHDWRLLERACGKDGIQALELDALAPNIAEVANRILRSAYGSKFTIEFRTTRMSGNGSRTKQLETFDIYIHDDEGGEQTLETLSGGEATWIRRAIYDAFGIIRARNTGTKFLTAIQDEADGALDPAAKERYFRMLEEAHAESGRYQTLIITHSREIQEMIQQTINITSLEARRSEEVAA